MCTLTPTLNTVMQVKLELLLINASRERLVIICWKMSDSVMYEISYCSSSAIVMVVFDPLTCPPVDCWPAELRLQRDVSPVCVPAEGWEYPSKAWGQTEPQTHSLWWLSSSCCLTCLDTHSKICRQAQRSSAVVFADWKISFFSSSSANVSDLAHQRPPLYA